MTHPESEKLFRFAPLSQYPLRKRIAVRAADLAFYRLIDFVGRTAVFEVEGQENLDAIYTAGQLPIYCTWHERIFLGTYFLRNRGIVFLTSKSFDGEYIARFLQRFGFGTIRGSSTRGGAKALVEMIREMKRGIPMGFTVDGPKGPRHEAKSGAVLLAKKTGNAILPFIVEPGKFYAVNSWDRLQIPRPWTRAKVIFGKPISVGPNADDAAMSAKLAELQTALDDLAEKGKTWRMG